MICKGKKDASWLLSWIVDVSLLLLLLAGIYLSTGEEASFSTYYDVWMTLMPDIQLHISIIHTTKILLVSYTMKLLTSVIFALRRIFLA
jgi:hypothetical protein